MREDQIVLHFETAPGEYPDTTTAAQALLDWVALVRAAVAAVSPAEQVSIEIVGVTPGSSRFPQLLKWSEDQIALVRSAWDEYPSLKKVIVGSAHTLATAAVGALITQAITPHEQLVRLSDTDRAAFHGLQEVVAADPSTQAASKRFYRTISRDRAITGVGVAENWNDRPSHIVPREQFAERSGLWDPQQDAPPEETRVAEWEVVLLRPNLVSKPQPWQFSRDGFKFNAKMADAKFLVALREGRVPLNMQEGVLMRVIVEYKEVLTGQIWEVVPQSRQITHVLSPAPLPQHSSK